MEKKQIIYAGSRNGGGKKEFKYVHVESPSEVAIFKRKIAKHERIGSIVESDVEGKTYSNSKIVGHVDKDEYADKILRWELEERDAIEELNVINDSKKVKPELDKIIDRLRDQMWGLSRMQKIRLARYIFEQLIK